MYTNGNGYLYIGDLQPGDREATPEEVTAWRAARTPPPIAQIRAIEQSISDATNRANRLVALEASIDIAVRTFKDTKGLTVTREQAKTWLLANDSNYQTLYNAEQLIRPLRALVV